MFSKQLRSAPRYLVKSVTAIAGASQDYGRPGLRGHLLRVGAVILTGLDA